MSLPLYELGGLRFWRENELRLRDRIKSSLVNCISRTLMDMNQMWAIEEVEAPVMMPASRLVGSYDRSDIFQLADPPGGTESYVLRPETTDGTYAIAEYMLRNGKRRPPLCLYQMGTSFRRETNDGATAAQLRFNAFTQLEFQLIYSTDTKADIAAATRVAVLMEIDNTRYNEVRIVPSDRLPSYSTETMDIEILRNSCQDPVEGRWFEVASTSCRTDFPNIPGQRECTVFELAFGMDRLVELSKY